MRYGIVKSLGVFSVVGFRQFRDFSLYVSPIMPIGGFSGLRGTVGASGGLGACTGVLGLLGRCPLLGVFWSVGGRGIGRGWSVGCPLSQKLNPYQRTLRNLSATPKQVASGCQANCQRLLVGACGCANSQNASECPSVREFPNCLRVPARSRIPKTTRIGAVRCKFPKTVLDK